MLGILTLAHQLVILRYGLVGVSMLLEMDSESLKTHLLSTSCVWPKIISSQLPDAAAMPGFCHHEL